MSLLASIPSPSDGVLHLGPLDIHAYGLMIALGVVAAVWLCGRRMEAAGVGTRDDMSAIALWAVAAGVIGARLYYVVTDKSQPWKEPGRWLKVWEGGLGIPGGLLAGVLVGVWAIKRRGLSVPGVLTAAAPAIPLAQAIGRIGNWWNQELYGRATDLPWALRIDDGNLPSGRPTAEFPSGTTFHPTFLYEVLWNLALMALLIIVGKRATLRPGRLMAWYVVGYFTGRFWIEGMRIDAAKSGGGLRLNQWVALVVVLLTLAFLLIDRARHSGEPVPTDEADEDAEPANDEADGDESADDEAADDDITAEIERDEPASAATDGDEYVPEDE